MRELTRFESMVEIAPHEPFGPVVAGRGVSGARALTVEIVAPDRYCAEVFVELTGSLFPLELVGTGGTWVIRLQPPAGPSWAGRLLLLVQSWLEACPLPCATIAYGGRTYVFRSALTHSTTWSGFEGPHDLDPSRAACTSTKARAGSRRPQIALAAKS